MNEIYLKFKNDFDKFLSKRVVEAADSLHVENIEVLDIQVHYHALNILANFILRCNSGNPFWFYYDSNEKRAKIDFKYLRQYTGKYCAEAISIPCTEKKLFANAKNAIQIFCDKFTI